MCVGTAVQCISCLHHSLCVRACMFVQEGERAGNGDGVGSVTGGRQKTREQ